MNNPIDEINQKIEDFLELKPGAIEEGNMLGKRIIETSGKIEELISDEELGNRYREIISRLKKQSSKLSSDLLNSESNHLSEDWKKFARKDNLKLRDEILALQEILSRHENELRRKFSERRYGIDLQDLVHRIENENSVDSLLSSQLSKSFSEMNEKKVQIKVAEFNERLNRISKWLLALKEVRMELENVEK